MRQAGLLAAGALYALQHHRERIGEDHAKAKRFAETVVKTPGVKVDLAGVQTNIVNVDLPSPLSGPGVAAACRPLGLAINATGPRRLRAVMHLDVAPKEVDRAAEILGEAIAGLRAASPGHD
jgi:threonine aldolase